MKVLYTFGGMPHYLNAMLNKLHNKGVEITVITPQKGNATISFLVPSLNSCTMAAFCSLSFLP